MEKGHTGSHCEELKTLVSISSPVVIALTDPVMAMVFTFLPYAVTLFNNSNPLSLHSNQHFDSLKNECYRSIQKKTHPLTLGSRKSFSKSLFRSSSSSGAAL
jgi:hypothetical protein